jgi:hypothetical protein
VSEIGGSVFLAPDASDTSWQPIGINYPVTIGDNVWVSQDGRAEIDFGAGQIRLSDEANVHFSQLDDRQFSAYLASGRAILRLRSLDPGETAKFDTANAQIDILRPGNYRVETRADGLYTKIVVRDGEAQLRVADRTVMVLTGQTAVIDGDSNGASLAVREGYGTDGFDAWGADRDRRWEAGGQSSRYVSSYVPGVNDLDDYGAWETAATYGAVWYPRTVAVDWVPYRDGRWTFVRPWGWTWVDSAPWGWAPFHYGRWVRFGNRWGWCPGTFVSRPVYAPALVAWYGGAAGTSWSVNFGAGPTFGWVPLAWGEPYWPHYRHSTDYWRVINRPYAVNVYRVPAKPLPAFSYANARIPGAVTAVSGEVFTGRRPIGGNHYAVSAAALAGAAITTTPLAVRPMTKPLAVDSLPRGIPAPASSLAGRGSSVRPDFRAPGAADGRPFTGQAGGVAGAISEPAPGNGKPGASPPAVVGRPTIAEPAPGTGRPTVGSPPTVGRPSINAPTPGQFRPEIRDPGLIANDPRQIRDPGLIANDPRQSGGQNFTPPARPSPGTRPAISEPAPTRPAVREPAPYNPGLSPSPQSPTAPQRPAAPVVREPAPMAPQYNPGMSPAPSNAPPPRPAAPVVREPAPMTAPAPNIAPAPVPGRPAPAPPGAVGRPTEPQIQLTPTPVPTPRSVAPTLGRLNDSESTRMRTPRPAPHLENGAIATSPQYRAMARSRQEVPREVREYRREQHGRPPQIAPQQARHDSPVAVPQNQHRSEPPQHARAQAEGVPR